MAQASETRLGAARRRASLAKLALAGGAILAFGASAALARVAYPGHAKKGSKSLQPPARFMEIVRRNQLEAGMLAPTQVSPETASAPS
jgi:hypothetical protein